MTINSEKFDIAIIGAGMSGILAASQLLQAGVQQIVVFEKGADLGGTWRDNRYPGLTCDVPSHHYTYSFEPNPYWTSHFAPAAEIHAYFRGAAEKYGVAPLIRLSTEIIEARYHGGRWLLTSQRGEQFECQFVIAATGVLHKPVYPDIDGLDTFAGPMFHTARWDQDIKLDGQRVGVIGNGSTGVQIVGAVVDQVQSLTLFQRTAQWIMPLANWDFTAAEIANFEANPDAMRAEYQRWQRQFQYSFSRAVIGDEEVTKKIEQLCEQYLATVRDPVLREALTPDYKAMCKRLIISDRFYGAIQQPQAHLVTESIIRVEPTGVRTADGTLHELDILVLATGFDGHNFMRPMNIVGLDGATLDEQWRSTNVAYRSVAMPNFPNFFMLIGPNSPIGNFSVILIAEIQLRYIMQLMAHCGDNAIMPSSAATDRFNQSLREAMADTVWVTGCKSWYLDKNGQPALWPWTFERFEQEMSRPDYREFEIIQR